MIKQRPLYWCVIPAAGVGKRMQTTVPKQYLALGGSTVIEQTLDRFINHSRIHGIIVALDAKDSYWSSLCITCDKPLVTVTGGAERCNSVLNALRYLHEAGARDDWVLVHDAARPCLTTTDIDLLIATLADDPVGGILAVPVRDTIKRGRTEDQRVVETVDRANLWYAFTPQMFRLKVLRRALQESLNKNVLVTDEASAIEKIGLRPKLVAGRADNIKITRPEDLALAEYYLARL